NPNVSNNNKIKNSYAAVHITNDNGSSSIGGLIGGTSNIAIENSYYDAVASHIPPRKAMDISKSTSEMQSPSTFNNWDFDSIWDINEGKSYPYLKPFKDKPTPEIKPGTEENPYLISTKEQLNNIRNDLTSHYKLVNDIDLENEEWMPIGSNTMPFTGMLDGNGHSIKNLKITENTHDSRGLFAIAKDSVIKNITIENVNITSRSKDNMGAFVGYVHGITLKNCSVIGEGAISGNNYLGGLIGRVDRGSKESKITRCKTMIDIHGVRSYIGGLVGGNNASITIERSYAICSLFGESSIGGLVGSSTNLTVTECYGNVNISGSGSLGGLVGSGQYMSMENCYALGKIENGSNSCIGELIGFFNYSNSVTNSYAAVHIMNDDNSSTIGGLVGSNRSINIYNSYYDAIASHIAPRKTTDISMLPSALKVQSTFVDWDFDSVWDINEGTYPYLRGLAVPTEVFKNIPINEVAGGCGTEENPYLIATKEQLNNIRNDLTSHYKLVSDIDLENEEWMPIGSNTMPFTGTLDGNDHSIKNLKITGNTHESRGLFAIAKDSVIKNITIENVNITSNSKDNMGAFVGRAYGITLKNCSVIGEGAISGNNYVGGLIGRVDRGSKESKITRCKMMIDIHGVKSCIGGLIGLNNAASTIERSYAICNLFGESSIGGLVGSSINLTVTECYGNVNISGSGPLGGLVGSGQYISMENCYALGKIENGSNNCIGGLIGFFNYSNNVTNSYAAVHIMNDDNSYTIGGLVGSNRSINIYNSYYDAIASCVSPRKTTDISMLPSALKVQSTFVDWDFDSVWNKSEGTYPYLRGLAVPTEAFKNIPINEVAGGCGTEENPYLIATKEQLNNMRNDLASYYKLVNDIDLENEEWMPIGSNTMPFTGMLDGNGHSIKNLKITENTHDSRGLFAIAKDSVIKNITIENVNITSRSKDNMGAFVGYVHGITLKNCSVIGEGAISGNNYLGGLIGRVDRGSKESKITRCKTMIDIHGVRSYIGGLVGGNNASITIERSYAICSLFGESSIGGLVGSSTNLTVTECYGNVNISGSGSLGGLVGSGQYMSMENCYALGKIENGSNSCIGELIGFFNYSNSVTNSYAAVHIMNDDNSSTIGGLVGSNRSINIYNSYYDAIASHIAPRKTTDISMLPSALKVQSTFVDWDFDSVWDINEGTYPYLRGLAVPTEVFKNIPINEVAGGCGTEENPYLIATKEQLNNIRNDLTSHYKLVSDIDLENEEWMPIGSNTMPFTGTLDGNDHSIKNLKITGNTHESRGLFAIAKDSVIKNITIENVNITSNSKDNMGAFVGRAYGITLKNCSVIGEGAISGNNYVGGLIGRVDRGSKESKITRCKMMIDIHGVKSCIGGLIGLNNAASTIERSYAICNLFGESSIGGLVGSSINLTVTECYGNVNISGSGPLGGLVGSGQYISMENCYALGKIENGSNNCIGGLIGFFNYSNNVTNSYAAVHIMNDDNSYTIGGLVGSNRSINIYNSYYDTVVSHIPPRKPTDIAKSTSEMKLRSTYVGWDFDNVWDMDEGSYPFLKMLPVPNHENLPDQSPPALPIVNKVEFDTINIMWKPYLSESVYEVKVDEQSVIASSDTFYNHTNLQSGTKHSYRVRVKNGDKLSSWSPRLYVYTLLPTPTGITYAIENDSIKLTWNSINNATAYDVEINGETINSTNSNTFVYSNITLKELYTFRVKAKNTHTQSEWSEPVTLLYAPDNLPSIYLTMSRWPMKDDDENSFDVLLKAINTNDLYTIYFELKYSDYLLELQKDQLQRILWDNVSNSYYAFKIDQEKSTLKVILSKLGNSAGESGDFNIIKIPFKFKNYYIDTKMTLESMEVLNSSGEPIDVYYNDLKIKRLSKM
ncbi:fibronectin type III domain-containing protein, partial [Marinisporobacter balticus]